MQNGPKAIMSARQLRAAASFACWSTRLDCHWDRKSWRDNGHRSRDEVQADIRDSYECSLVASFCKTFWGFEHQPFVGEHLAEAPSGRSRATGASGVHVERSGAALHDLLRDHDLLDAFETWQVEHSFKEYSLHDGAQPARPGLAVDSLPSAGAECSPPHSELAPLHLEQLPILLE